MAAIEVKALSATAFAPTPVDDATRRAVLTSVRRLLRVHRLQFPLPRALTRDRLASVDRRHLRFGHKADGSRQLLAFLPIGAFFLDRNEKVLRLDKQGSTLGTVFDGEWLPKTGMFWAFDLLASRGECETLVPFDKREAKRIGTIKDLNRPYLKNKPWHKQVNAVALLPDGFEADGIILMDDREPWMSTKILKWKPQPTLDVYWEAGDGKTVHVWYEGQDGKKAPLWLADGHRTHDALVPERLRETVQNKPSSLVAEVALQDGRWTLIGFRPDKPKANYWTVVEETMQVALDNITLDALIDQLSPGSKRTRTS